MNKLNPSVERELEHIQSKTGRTVNELAVIVDQNGFHEHDEIRDLFHREMGLRYDEASVLTQAILQLSKSNIAKQLNEMDDELIAWISLTYEHAA